MSSNKTLILNHQGISQKINRLAYQIYENNYAEKELIVVGITSNGYTLAKKITAVLKKISSINITLTELTVNKRNPLKSPVKLNLSPNDLNGKVVILVDDVLKSGKTLIYGVKYLLDFPMKSLSTLVLIDRNYKQYPIGAHYVGLSLSTTIQDHVTVEFNGNKQDAVYLS